MISECAKLKGLVHCFLGIQKITHQIARRHYVLIVCKRTWHTLSNRRNNLCHCLCQNGAKIGEQIGKNLNNANGKNLNNANGKNLNNANGKNLNNANGKNLNNANGKNLNNANGKNLNNANAIAAMLERMHTRHCSHALLVKIMVAIFNFVDEIKESIDGFE